MRQGLERGRERLRTREEGRDLPERGRRRCNFASARGVTCPASPRRGRGTSRRPDLPAALASFSQTRGLRGGG